MFSHPEASEQWVEVLGGGGMADDLDGRPDEPAGKTDTWQRTQTLVTLINFINKK